MDLESAQAQQAGGRKRNPMDDLKREIMIMKKMKHLNIVVSFEAGRFWGGGGGCAVCCVGEERSSIRPNRTQNTPNTPNSRFNRMSGS